MRRLCTPALKMGTRRSRTPPFRFSVRTKNVDKIKTPVLRSIVLRAFDVMFNCDIDRLECRKSLPSFGGQRRVCNGQVIDEPFYAVVSASVSVRYDETRRYGDAHRRVHDSPCTAVYYFTITEIDNPIQTLKRIKTCQYRSRQSFCSVVAVFMY